MSDGVFRRLTVAESPRMAVDPPVPWFQGYYNQRIGQSQVQASGRSEDDKVGNSPGVRWELAEDIGSLSGWRKGVRREKTEIRFKIIEGSRKA
ncbi:hypothetical protein B296_00003308 [Ensete ventricosum]|uniref:Uncharacterized protein n=1 Tax=Ensete ventricosum TaxID=4639 RepID=A0A427AZG8_ENSVE|nr:hypothetical protein B296_00003308 [Ensete ventricosum]